MELVIAQSVNDFASLEKLLSTTTDILVFDQGAMIVLDEKCVTYKVIEDFYTADQYYQDACTYHKKVEDLLSQLDKACESILDFPYAYSGNEHYLLTWFDDLLYLEKLIQTIQNKYEKVYLYATNKPEKISSNYFNFSMLNSYRVNGTISFPAERSIKRKIQLIDNSIDLCFVKDAPCAQKHIPTMLKVKHFLNKVHGYIGRRVPVKNNKRREHKELNSKNIYVIQDGYEVLYLKRYLPKFKYLNPVTQLRQNIEIEQPIDLLSISINNVLEDFIKSYFLFLGKYIHLLISSYHLEVVGRISSFKEQFEYLTKKDKPNLLLLSAGTRDVFDSVCCYVANYCNIPVIIFQHGGHSLFSYNPYQESLENNQKVLKTLIVQSNKEVDKIQNNETTTLYMGSIQQYEKNHTSYREPTKDVLFCLGPDTNLVFRHLLNYYSINKKHRQSIEVINTAKDVSLAVDIKLHPSGEKDSYDRYATIIKNNQCKNIDILYGSFGEVVSKNYKLIIIDFLASALTKHIFCLKIPVIIYDRDFDKIRVSDNILADIYRRCYIARDQNELCELLERYKAENLPSKWSLDFIDKYIYPVDNGVPGENTAKYICNIVK